LEEKGTMRGLVSWMVGLSLSLSTLWPGCAAAYEKDTLTLWCGSDKGYAGLEKLGQEYTARTGIKVVVRHFDDAVAAFEEAMKAGGADAPDIWIWAHDRLGDWAKRGWVSPIEPSQDLRADIVQVGWDAFTLNGKVWGYPLSVEAVALVYNKALLPSPPKAFEDLPAIDQQLKAKGVRAIGWETGSAYFSWPLLAANGAYVFQRRIDGSYEPRDTGINHPGAVQGADFLAKMITGGVLPQGGMRYADAETAMQTGRQAMWITGPWAWEGLRAKKIDFGVVPLPTLGGKPARPFVGVLGAMLVHGSPNQKRAADFIEHTLLPKPGLTTLNAAKPIGVPASKAMFWSLYSDPNMRASMEAIYAGRPMPSNAEMTLFWQHLTAALQAINTGSKPPRQALDDAAMAITGAAKTPPKR